MTSAEIQSVLEAHRAGRLETPLEAYRALFARGCLDASVRMNLAQLEIVHGSLGQAASHAQAVATLHPDYTLAWFVLGFAQRRLGQLRSSINSLRTALSLDPQHLGAWICLSVALHDVGELDDALKACDAALQLDAQSAAAWANSSMVYLALGRFDEACSSAKEAIRLDPQLAEAYLNLGNALHASECWDEAIASFQQALALNPGLVPALSSLGNALKADDQLEAAVQVFDQAISLDPSYYQAYSNRAITLRALGRLDEGLVSCRKALKLASKSPDVHSNHGVLLHESGQLQEAEKAFRRAIKLQSDHAEAQFCLAMVLLQQGSFAEGWQRYEWRFEHNSRHPIVRELSEVPTWDGSTQSPVPELVLLHEQGLGDSFQFIRFAGLLRPFVDRLVFSCPKPLHGIVESSGLVDAVLPLDFPSDQLSSESRVLPLMSVPRLLQLTTDHASSLVPYLPVDPSRVEFWSQQLHGRGSGPGSFLIALNWQGNPAHEKTTSRGRSLPLEALAPLASLPGVRFVSLQKGYGSEQLQACSFRDLFVSCQEAVDRAWDFEDSAALMQCADLVISSDTSAAHLAGAIGAPLWIPLKQVPEWRWGLLGGETPWYPTARLFRQKQPGDWSGPVLEMRSALEQEILDRAC